MNDQLTVDNLSQTFIAKSGKRVAALSGLSFSIKNGEFVSIVGPSGCGKTTLIKIIGGLQKASRGRVYLDGKKVGGPMRETGVVFQKYTSFPWLNVLKNIEFGLKMYGVTQGEREKVAREYIKIVGLSGFERAYPKSLSGGMRQRVALARTLAANPEILLMDEPFSSLDTQTRRFMQDLLLQIWKKTQKTVLFVTHDVDEALFMADRVIVMGSKPGSIKKIFRIPLPRPRTIKIEFSSEYIKLKEQVQTIITQESLKSLEEPVAEAIRKLY